MHPRGDVTGAPRNSVSEVAPVVNRESLRTRMQLESGGIDVYYIDESMDADTFAMSAVPIPLLRCVEGSWTFTWENQFQRIRDWRRRASALYGLPVRSELKGSKLASGRGRYRSGEHQFSREQAATVLRSMLSDLSFLQAGGIITVIGDRNSRLYGHSRLEALLFALLQRMRTACARSQRRGLVFFDEGHGEYRTLYRKARVYLPTGSHQGAWRSGSSTRNIPLDNFTKDANFKQSQHCFFTQLADIISYAAFLKAKSARGRLVDWQQACDLGTLYDSIPTNTLNLMASRRDPQGIVRL